MFTFRTHTRHSDTLKQSRLSKHVVLDLTDTLAHSRNQPR